MRMKYESEINSLTITIETLESQILVLKSNTLALEEDLGKKRDVERQLDESRNREQKNH